VQAWALLETVVGRPVYLPRPFTASAALASYGHARSSVLGLR
jgi:hypothetical protein